MPKVPKINEFYLSPSASGGYVFRADSQVNPVYELGNIAVIFFHHRDTEDTEDIFLFTDRETTMSKKSLYLQ